MLQAALPIFRKMWKTSTTFVSRSRKTYAISTRSLTILRTREKTARTAPCRWKLFHPVAAANLLHGHATAITHRFNRAAPWPAATEEEEAGYRKRALRRWAIG